ncbi:MAG: hypothetical protein LLG02_11250 [Pelosinus sp.]|nr:hypothetical protein [Pelosinus sp.]
MHTHGMSSEIMFYQRQLYELGYSPDQVSELIAKEIGATNLDELDENQYCELISTLESHLVFARDCKAY